MTTGGAHKFIKVNSLWARGKNRATCCGRFLTNLVRVTLWQYFFVVVRSLTVDSNLLQATGCVNSTPHTSHFLVVHSDITPDAQTSPTSNKGSRRCDHSDINMCTPVGLGASIGLTGVCLPLSAHPSRNTLAWDVRLSEWAVRPSHPAMRVCRQVCRYKLLISLLVTSTSTQWMQKQQVLSIEIDKSLAHLRAGVVTLQSASVSSVEAISARSDWPLLSRQGQHALRHTGGRPRPSPPARWGRPSGEKQKTTFFRRPAGAWGLAPAGWWIPTECVPGLFPFWSEQGYRYEILWRILPRRRWCLSRPCAKNGSDNAHLFFQTDAACPQFIFTHSSMGFQYSTNNPLAVRKPADVFERQARAFDERQMEKRLARFWSAANKLITKHWQYRPGDPSRTCRRQEERQSVCCGCRRRCEKASLFFSLGKMAQRWKIQQFPSGNRKDWSFLQIFGLPPARSTSYTAPFHQRSRHENDDKWRPNLQAGLVAKREDFKKKQRRSCCTVFGKNKERSIRSSQRTAQHDKEMSWTLCSKNNWQDDRWNANGCKADEQCSMSIWKQVTNTASSVEDFQGELWSSWFYFHAISLAGNSDSRVSDGGCRRNKHLVARTFFCLCQSVHRALYFFTFTRTRVAQRPRWAQVLSRLCSRYLRAL